MHPAPDAALQDNEPPLIDPAELPDSSDMELNYIVEPMGPIAFAKFAKTQYIALCAVALTVTAISYWIGDQFATHNGILFQIFMGPVAFIFVKRIKNKHEVNHPLVWRQISTKTFVFIFFAPCIFGLLFALFRSFYLNLFFLLLPIAIAGLFYLVHQVFTFLIDTIRVHPECNFNDVLKELPFNSAWIFMAPILGVVAFLILFLGAYVFFGTWFGPSFSGESPGTPSFILPIGISWAIIWGSLKKDGMPLKELWTATNFFLYTWIASLRGGASDFPGVYKPRKSGLVRWFLTAGVFCLISLAVLPATSYFPLGYEIGPRRYVEQHYITMQRQAGFEELHGISLSVPASILMGVTLGEPQHLADPQGDIDERTPLEKVNEWREDEIRKFFREVPFGSVLFFLDLAFAKNAFFIIPAVFSLVLCFFTPLVVFYTAFIIGEIVGIGRQLDFTDLTDLIHPPALSHKTWEEYVRRLQHSEDGFEHEHLFIGTHHPSDIPILLDRSVLEGHAYISGDSGSGKTALGIIPMLTQLIRSASRSYEARAIDASFVILDLKGDSALFNTVKEEAEGAGLPFRWFTSEAGHSSYTFNPLDQRAFDELSEISMTELQMAALSLEHGEGYGKSYFSRRARSFLYRIMNGDSLKKGAASQKGERPRSFKEVSEIALDHQRNTTIPVKERQDTYEVLSISQTLAAFPQLNASGRAQGAIDMADVINSPQVVYFWLPASITSASVREIGKLALYSLLAAAYQRSRSDKPRMNTYCFIDEFQRIAADNFRLILQQARSMKIPMILSNQTPTDLREGANDFFPTVQGNTRVWHSFAAGDIYHQDLLVNSSGEVLRLMQGLSEGTRDISRSTQQIIRPRISKNHLLEMSDDEKSGVFHLKRGAGYSRYRGFPMVVNSTYSMSWNEYQRREKCPWPEGNEQTVTAKIKSSKIDTPST